MESTWGTAVSAVNSFGANVTIGSAKQGSEIVIKSGIGSVLPVAGFAGATTTTFSLDFYMLNAKASVDWVQSILGTADLSTDTRTMPSSTAANYNNPKSMTIVVYADPTSASAATASVTYTFAGCYCTSAKFETAAGEAIHVTADFIGKTPTINEAASMSTVFPTGVSAPFEWTMASVTSAASSNAFATSSIERITVTISRDVQQKNGIGTRLPQAMVASVLNFQMDLTLAFETAKTFINFANKDATATTPDAYALTDTQLKLWIVVSNTNYLSFLGAGMLVADHTLSVSQNDPVIQDVSLKGTKITMVGTGSSWGALL